MSLGTCDTEDDDGTSRNVSETFSDDTGPRKSGVPNIWLELVDVDVVGF